MKARVSSADSYHPHQMLRRATRSPLGFEISPAFEFDWFYHLVRSPQPWTLFLGMHRVYRVCLIYCTKFPCFFPRLRFSITSRILFFFFFLILERNMDMTMISNWCFTIWSVRIRVISHETGSLEAMGIRVFSSTLSSRLLWKNTRSSYISLISRSEQESGDLLWWHWWVLQTCNDSQTWSQLFKNI